MSDTHNPYAPPQSDIVLEVKNNEYSTVNLFSPKGRIGRLRFFAYAMTEGIIIFAIMFYLYSYVHYLFEYGFFKNADGRTNLSIIIVIYCVILMPFIMVLVMQRLHDIGFSGRFVLLMLIPELNIAFCLFLIFMPGMPTPNKFGAPLAPNTLADIVYSMLLVVGYVMIAI